MINSMILVQQNLVTILLSNIEKIVNSSNKVDVKYSDDVIKILENLKNSLELCNKNIALLQNAKKETETNSENITNYNETIKIVNQNTIIVETFLHSLLQFTEFNFSDNNAAEIEKEINVEDMDLKENTEKVKDITAF